MEIFNQSLTTLERSLDLRMENQRVIASNLANVDTQGYTARKLDFEASMRNAIEGMSDPAVVEDSPAPATSLDGNNVNLESELSEMSRNKLMYSVTSQIMAAKLRQLATVFEQNQ